VLLPDLQLRHLCLIDGEQVTPLSRIVNVYEYLDYITNRVMPDCFTTSGAGSGTL